MNILIVHEIDWLKKVIFEPHHFAELFSIKNHQVFVIDCPSPDPDNLRDGLHTSIIPNYHRVYDNSSITIVRPPSLRLKGLNRFTNFITCKKIIKKIVIEKKIDVILLYGVATNGIQTIKVGQELGIPIVFRALDVSHGLVRIPILRQLTKKYEKFVLTNAAKIFTTTSELASYVIEMGADIKKVKTFVLGVNLSVFKPLKKDYKLAKNLGIFEEDKVIVFMGTLYDFAGVDEIIVNFDKLKNKIKNIKFLIIGGGPALKYFQSIVRKKKLESDVKFTDFVPQKQIPKYIALGDICLNPFRVNYVTNRILPTKILEYFACGKPVLSTPLQGTKNLLPNEEFGITYSESTDFVETLAALICEEEKLRELGEKGLLYVKKHHDWNVLTDNLLGELKDIVRTK